MKVLIYSIYKSAFLEKGLYEGFVKVAGNRNIFLYKASDYSAKTTPFKIENKMKTLNDHEIKEKADDFDYIFFFNSAFLDKNFYSVLNTQTSAKKIFIDQMDDFFVRRIYKHPEISYYFKRELYKQSLSVVKNTEWYLRYLYELTRSPGIKNKRLRWFSYWNMPIGSAYVKKFNDVKSLPLTISTYRKKINFLKRRKFDISFIGHLDNLERAKYIHLLKEYSDKIGISNKISDRRVEKGVYFSTIKKSKAGISVRGTGYDTFRYWEIPAYGAALISQRNPLVIPYIFIHGKSALFFNNFDELKHIIQKYIVNSNDWVDIARNGHTHFLQHHTPERRVQMLLDEISK